MKSMTRSEWLLELGKVYKDVDTLGDAHYKTQVEWSGVLKWSQHPLQQFLKMAKVLGLLDTKPIMVEKTNGWLYRARGHRFRVKEIKALKKCSVHPQYKALHRPVYCKDCWGWYIKKQLQSRGIL